MKRRWPGLLAAFVIGLIFLPVLLLLLAVTGRLPSDSLSAPPGLENGLGERALEASLERRAEGVRNPVAAGDEAALIAGMEIYRDNCAGCHGGARGPSAWGSNGFYPRVPQFWQQHHEHITPAEAFVAVRDGIRYSGMGAWRGTLSEPEMWRVANFVSRIHALPPRVDASWRAGPAAAQ
jgi:mono/diheme cytochrome c family protein